MHTAIGLLGPDVTPEMCLHLFDKQMMRPVIRPSHVNRPLSIGRCLSRIQEWVNKLQIIILLVMVLLELLDLARKRAYLVFGRNSRLVDDS